MGARVETSFAAGMNLAVELSGTADDESLAQRVLALGVRELVERQERVEPEPTRAHPVALYNEAVGQFPTVLVARLFSFRPAALF